MGDEVSPDMPIRQFKPWAPNALRRLRSQFSFDGRAAATQAEIAAAIKVGLNRYFRLENGFSVPTSREVRVLAKLFKVPPAKLGFDQVEDSSKVAVYDERSA